jgi:hypothetical protein
MQQKLLLKKKVPLAAILISIALYGNSQEIKFTEAGLLKNFPLAALYSKKDIKLANPCVIKSELTPEEKNLIKKDLLAFVKTALNNLDDDKLNLEKTYTAIWKDDTYVTLKTELNWLKKYLKDNIPYLNATLIPAHAKIEDLLNSTAIIKADSSCKKDSITITVLQNDIIKKFLLKMYNVSIAGLTQDMDISLIKGWRRLEEYTTTANQYIEKLKTIQGQADACDKQEIDKIGAFIRDFTIESNSIVKLLKENKFFKEWLWYTGGIPYINPLPATTADQLYPETEPNSLLTKELRDKQNAPENLLALESLQKTDVTVNKIKLPLSKDKYNTRWLVQYDYARSYASNKNDMPKAFSDKESLVWLTHNVPITKQVKYSITEKEIANESTVVSEIKTGISSLQSFVSLLNPAAGIFKAIISPLFNTSGNDIKKLNIPANTNPNITATLSTNFKKNDANLSSPLEIAHFSKSTLTVSDSVAALFENSEEPANDFDKIKVGDIEIPISRRAETDKANILVAYFTKILDAGCRVDCDKDAKALIAAFLKKADCYTLRYINKGTLEADVENLLHKFDCFAKEIKKCQDKAEKYPGKLKEIINNLKPYIQITNRSMPPIKLAEKRSEIPQYSTVIEYGTTVLQSVSKAKEIIVSVKESDINAKASDTAKAVASFKTKIGKLQYFILSAGISFTAAPYNVSRIGNNSLPDNSSGERFRLLAGLHVYPFGLFNLDNRFAHGLRHRLSAFAGLSVPKPLENYHAGISYDLVPGIKLIGGYHLYKQTKFTVLNNQVADKIAAPKGAGFFLAINFTSEIAVNLINIFKR